VTHLVVGVGTGGTISGIGRYLKERNPKIKVWGIDTYGSVFKKYKETGIFDKNEIYPYITEGIGEDFLPSNVDFDIIDHFEKVTDKDAALMTRRLAREEGIWVGNSAGSAMAGLLQLKEHFTAGDVVVVVFHDHGSRYMAKMFNDEWMRSKGFFEVMGMTARDLVAMGGAGELFAVEAARPVEDAAKLMSSHDFSQVSVTKNGRHHRIAERDTPLRGAGRESRHPPAAGRGHHAAGLPVRGHLHAGGAAGDDDQPAEPRGARPRFHRREDLHHHALGHHPRPDVSHARRRPDRRRARTRGECRARG
jgi:hypothetical protein